MQKGMDGRETADQRRFEGIFIFPDSFFQLIKGWKFHRYLFFFAV